MTARRDRLARLLGIRTVALQVASRDLGRAAGTAAAIGALARRIGELQRELTPAILVSTGAQLKAAAATRNGLQLAATRQLARLDAATAQRADAARAVHRHRAAVDAVARALERRAAGRAGATASAASHDPPVRKPGR